MTHILRIDEMAIRNKANFDKAIAASNARKEEERLRQEADELKKEQELSAKMNQVIRKLKSLLKGFSKKNAIDVFDTYMYAIDNGLNIDSGDVEFVKCKEDYGKKDYRLVATHFYVEDTKGVNYMIHLGYNINTRKMFLWGSYPDRKTYNMITFIDNHDVDFNKETEMDFDVNDPDFCDYSPLVLYYDATMFYFGIDDWGTNIEDCVDVQGDSFLQGLEKAIADFNNTCERIFNAAN